jgi:succinate dehydrogenase / fumarate reductase iron-sulfur subunit
MKVKFKIQRYDPTNGSKPYYQTYEVEAEPTDRVLDCLHTILWEQDGTLAFRRSCSHGVCGSDAMRINRKNRLACQTLLQDLSTRRPIIIEPVPALPIVKDLVVDMTDFFRKYEVIKPYLISKTPPPPKERLQSPADRALIDEAAKCILCGACTTSCPSNWSDPSYLGPAALLKAYRFIFDSRDEAAAERLSVLDDQHGLWRCHTIFNCMEVCPKDINVTWHISQLKKRAALRET